MRRLVTTLAATAAALTCLTPFAAHARGAAGVCTGVPHCRVVAHDDVDGDFKNDTIALHRETGALVEVRVLTRAGSLLTSRVTLGPGQVSDPWGGSAAIDNAPGDDLLLLTQPGSRTRGYTVLRYRHGMLRREAAPDGSRRWLVAGTGSPLLGWHQYFGDIGGDHMIRISAARRHDGSYAGSKTTYGWHHGGWVRLHGGRPVVYLNRKAAERAVGFHITGLEQFPGS
jgi:hypothetical protein